MQKIQECLSLGLLTPELLHEKVLNCLGEQRRAPQRRQKYIEKKQKKNNAEITSITFDGDTDTVSDEVSDGSGLETTPHNFMSLPTGHHDSVDSTLNLVQANNR